MGERRKLSRKFKAEAVRLVKNTGARTGEEARYLGVRQDMALFTFTHRISAGEPIELFDEGWMRRNFTSIDDVIEGVVRVLDKPPTADPEWRSDTPDPATSATPNPLCNIGNSQSVYLLEFVRWAFEDALGKQAIINLIPMQAGDVVDTFAYTVDLEDAIDCRPGTPAGEGLRRFVRWNCYEPIGELAGMMARPVRSPR